jgi:hypothetical protein
LLAATTPFLCNQRIWLKKDNIGPYKRIIRRRMDKSEYGT